MSAIASEMQSIVFDAAKPVHPGDSIKAQIRRAWVNLEWPPYWRVRAAWYGEAGCWVAVAAEDFRARAEQRRRKEEAGRAKAAKLGKTYLDAADRLRAIDQDFHCAEIARLERLACQVGSLDRPGTETEGD